MELIETLENKIDGIIWVTERYGIDGKVNFENTYPKQNEKTENN